MKKTGQRERPLKTGGRLHLATRRSYSVALTDTGIGRSSRWFMCSRRLSWSDLLAFSTHGTRLERLVSGTILQFHVKFYD